MVDPAKPEWESFKKQIVALAVSCQYGLPLSELEAQYRDVADEEFELSEVMEFYGIPDKETLVDRMSDKLILLERKLGAELLRIPWPPKVPRNFGRTEADRERRQTAQDLVEEIIATANELCIFVAADAALSHLLKHIRNQRPSAVSRIGGIVPGIRGNRNSQLPYSSGSRPRSLTPSGSSPTVRRRQDSHESDDRARSQSPNVAPRLEDVGSSSSGSMEMLDDRTRSHQSVETIIDSAASGSEVIHVVHFKEENVVPLYNNIGEQIPRELRESLIIANQPLVELDQDPQDRPSTSAVSTRPFTLVSDSDTRLAFEEAIPSTSKHCAEQDFLNYIGSQNTSPDQADVHRSLDDVRTGSQTDYPSRVLETREDTVERHSSQRSLAPANHEASQPSSDARLTQENSAGNLSDVEEKQKLLLNGIVIIEQAPRLDSNLPEAEHWDGIFSILNILARKDGDWIRLETLSVLYSVLFDSELPTGRLSHAFLDAISCFVRFDYDEFGSVWLNLRQAREGVATKFSDLTPSDCQENLKVAQIQPESLKMAPFRRKDLTAGSTKIWTEIRQRVFAMVLDHFGIGMDSEQMIEAYWIKYGADLREWVGGRSGLDLFQNELKDLFIVRQKSPMHAMIYPRLDVAEIPVKVLRKWGLTEVYSNLRQPSPPISSKHSSGSSKVPNRFIPE